MPRIVDVSEHNGFIDWEKVAAQGDVHAIIRCGYGQDIKSQDDKRWQRNIEACQELGIPCGAYLYSYASSADAAEGEAAHMLRLVEDYKFQYPLYIDVEECRYRLVAPEVCQRFCSVMEKAGYYVGVYANNDWWANYLFGLDRYDKWIARWSVNEPTVKCGLWQYTNKGHVSGIPDTSEGGIDMNRAFVDYPALLEKFYGGVVSERPFDLDELALAVMRGEFGNNSERKKALGEKYDSVQERVNWLYTDAGVTYLADRVIAGDFGNGGERKRLLGPAYVNVQKKVNAILR